MICRSCGAENNNSAKFCTNCGQPLIERQPTVPPQQDYPEAYIPQQSYPPQDNNAPQYDYPPQGNNAQYYPPQQSYPPQQQYPNQQPYPPQNYYPQQGYYPAPEPKRKSVLPRVLLVLLAVIIGLSVIVCAVYYMMKGHLPFVELKEVDPTVAAVSFDSNNTVEESENYVEETAAPTEAPVPESATYFKSAKASSTLGDMGGYNYSASNVLKDDGTCWCEGAKGYGIGESITLELPEKQRVSGLYIRNGYAGTEKQYKDNATLEDIEIVFSEGERTTATLKTLSTSQRKSIQKITFPRPVDTTSVKIIIKSTSKADCEDTCLTYAAPF